MKSKLFTCVPHSAHHNPVPVLTLQRRKQKHPSQIVESVRTCIQIVQNTSHPVHCVLQTYFFVCVSVCVPFLLFLGKYVCV